MSAKHYSRWFHSGGPLLGVIVDFFLRGVGGSIEVSLCWSVQRAAAAARLGQSLAKVSWSVVLSTSGCCCVKERVQWHMKLLLWCTCLLIPKSLYQWVQYSALSNHYLVNQLNPPITHCPQMTLCNQSWWDILCVSMVDNVIGELRSVHIKNLM